MSATTRIADPLGVDPRALIGLAVIVGGLLLWAMAFTGGLAGLLSGSGTTLKADFASVEDIVVNDPVRIEGVEVGSVSGVTRDPDGRGATVTMNLDSSAGKIYANASASVVWRTALGANDAIRIDPGTPSAGQLASATIPRSKTSNQVELDQITQVLHGDAQSGTRTILNQLPVALQDPNAPAQAFNTLANVAPDATTGIGALRGQNPDVDLRDLVQKAGHAVQALSAGTGASQTREFVQSAATALDAAGADPQALQATISGLSRVIPQSQRTFANLDHSLNLLDPLMAKLTPEVEQVAPTLAALNPTVTHADTLLHKATPLLHQLKPTVTSLASTAKIGVPIINNVKPSLDRLKDTVLPALTKKYPEEGDVRPYEMVGAMVVGLSNIAESFDANAGIVNLTLGLGEPQAQQILPCNIDFSGTDFLVCESLSTALSGFFGGGSQAQSLAQRAVGTAAESVFKALGTKASAANSKLGQLQQLLSAKSPQVAKFLFSPNHGASR